MFRTANSEPREYLVQAVHASASNGNSELRPKPSLFVDRSANAVTQTAYSRGGLPAYMVRRVREHIENNIDQRITVEGLAKLVNLSVSYFVRSFKQSVGNTPHDYLMRRRLERTMELLAGTDLPLSEIALAVGFSDQSHCARRFRQHLGMSPREYRRAPRRGLPERVCNSAAFLSGRGSGRDPQSSACPPPPEMLLRRLPKATRRRVIWAGD